MKIPLARTHFDINKFSAATEPSYKIVREVIQEMAGGAADLLRKCSQDSSPHGESRASTFSNFGAGAQNIHMGNGPQNNQNGPGQQFNGGQHVFHGR